jgi:hypothetical protein
MQTSSLPPQANPSFQVLLFGNAIVAGAPP